MPRSREIETLLLTMYAAVPLYFTAAIGPAPLAMFHVVMAGIILRVALGQSPELIPAGLMRVLAIIYVPFYILDAWMLSQSAIAASTHLVLFIAAYQPVESVRVNNYAQRLLTTALIFTASLATSTHMSIVLFVVVFGFVMFRQMMYVSHVETIRALGRDFTLAPTSRAAGFYVTGTLLIGAMLFPILPRLRNPMVQAFTGSLGNTATGLSESIDFNQSRTSSPDPAVVARVWMGQDAVPFFTPLRLRGAVYESYDRNRWLQGPAQLRPQIPQDGVFRIARPVGFQRRAVVQQRLGRRARLFLPSGTHAISGITHLYEGPSRDTYMMLVGGQVDLSYTVWMSRSVEPLRAQRVSVVRYPVRPEVDALARRIVGNETDPMRKAARIEGYLSSTFQYVQRPEEIGGSPMTVDDFLLKVKKGHCEYFAAGMVALMTAADVPARIVGGFYGGRLNPLTGYFLVRREDAHAWVEVWDGSKWETFDPTPVSLRPGRNQGGLLRLYATAVGDSVTYFWDRYVLTFGLADQINLAVELISRLRGFSFGLKGALTGVKRTIFSPLAQGLVAGLVALGLGILLFRSTRRPLFSHIAAHLRRRGIDVSPAMTVEEALEMVRASDADGARELEEIIALYESEQFSGSHDRARVAAVRRRLAQMRV